jgi:hypothetical protein
VETCIGHPDQPAALYNLTDGRAEEYHRADVASEADGKNYRDIRASKNAGSGN